MVFPASWRRLFSALVVTAASKTKMMLLLFSVLYSVWTANYTASNGDAIRELSAHFLELAEKQGATAPLLIGYRVMGFPWHPPETLLKGGYILIGQ